MRRREFLLLINGAATIWSMTARAQQRTMPVVGFLDPTSLDKYAPFVAAFRNGLSEVGFVEDRDVTIEYRWAEGKYDRLPMIAADLVKRQVAVIVATGITAARAAKAATETIPIVFNTGGDPVKFGLVGSLNRPERNVTGVASLGKVLVAKQFELLHEIVPNADAVAFLVNQNNAVATLDTSDARAAAAALKKKLIVVKAATRDEIETAFRSIIEQGGGAVVVQTDPFFLGRRDQIVALAAQTRIPAIYYLSDYPAAGGLMSYGSSLADALRLVGNYTGRLLKGATPADLPVQQSVKVELVINLKTAKSLGLTVPASLLAAADEVIE
ncbi:MAG: ABC transporter substrate-binding protein [Alphaproteobacteria bacterium]|nr:MAG: ABC transporter substrate-binding protein [Alphaproteobacteria bacterium]